MSPFWVIIDAALLIFLVPEIWRLIVKYFRLD
jgi:hypothetical protein